MTAIATEAMPLDPFRDGEYSDSYVTFEHPFDAIRNGEPIPGTDAVRADRSTSPLPLGPDKRLESMHEGELIRILGFEAYKSASAEERQQRGEFIGPLLPTESQKNIQDYLLKVRDRAVSTHSAEFIENTMTQMGDIVVLAGLDIVPENIDTATKVRILSRVLEADKRISSIKGEPQVPISEKDPTHFKKILKALAHQRKKSGAGSR